MSSGEEKDETENWFNYVDIAGVMRKALMHEWILLLILKFVYDIM